MGRYNGSESAGVNYLNYTKIKADKNISQLP